MTQKRSLVALTILLSANVVPVCGFHSSALSTPRSVSTVSPAEGVARNSCLGSTGSTTPCKKKYPLHILNVQSNKVGGDSSVTLRHAADAAPATPPPDSGEIEINGGTESSTAAEHAQNKITSADKVVIWTALVGIASAFAAVIKISGPGAWRYYAAGGICAAVSHGITTPIDVVKTRQQVDPTLRGKGMVKATMKIIKNDGIQTLLSGLGPTTWGYLFEGAVKFGIYEVLKPAVRQLLIWLATVTSIASLNNKILGFTICGCMSGVAASFMLCPMEALRIRLVSEPDFAPEGWVHGFLRMLKYEGVGGLWKGMNAMMLKQVPYTITKNVSFDFITTTAYLAVKGWGYAITANMKLLIPLVSAFAASVLSTITSQPGDMLLSAVNAHEGDRTVWDFSRDIRETEGIKGYFRGMRARFVHVGLIVTVQLMIYDIVKRLVGIAATGST